MKTIKVKIENIVWTGDDADDVSTEFLVEEDIDNLDEYFFDEEFDAPLFVQDWLDYNGSKWGVTAEDFDFTCIND